MSAVVERSGFSVDGSLEAAQAALASLPRREQLEEAIQLARGRAIPMHQMLTGVCTLQACTFSFRGRDLPAHQVMAPEMFLPMVTGTAQDDGRYLLDVDFGCGLRLDEESLFGVRSVVPHITGHIADVVRALFFLNAAHKTFGLRPNACIDLTATYEIMNEQFQGLRKALGSPEGEIPWPHPPRLN